MTRSGETMLQVMLYCMVLGLLLEIGNEAVTLVRVDRASGTDSLAIDRACDRLRRDLAAGATTDGTALVSGKIRWEVRDGQLARNGLALIAVRHASWRQDDAAWLVSLQPLRGAPRILRVSATEWR